MPVRRISVIVTLCDISKDARCGLGPMQGQMMHFKRHVRKPIPHAIDRYTTETRRLYSVLEKQLASSSSGYIISKFMIVDIVFWSMVAASGWAGIDLDEYPATSIWYSMLLKRPSVGKGMNVPEPHPIQVLMDDKRERKRKSLKSIVAAGFYWA